MVSKFSIAYAAMNGRFRGNNYRELFSIAYAAMNGDLGQYLPFVVFSIAYAAMNHTGHPALARKIFSIAYAAMNEQVAASVGAKLFSIAYAAMNTAPGPLRLAYVAGGSLQDEFDFWAGCVMYAGRYVEPLEAIAEELADVTSPGKAPGCWGILIRRGLKRGITLRCISQRWSEDRKSVV